MYRYLDRHVHALETHERLLLWSMRQWVAATSTGRCPCAILGLAFESWHLTATLPHFAKAMFVLNTRAQAPLRFNPPCMPVIGDDEARLLALFNAGRSGTREPVRRIADGLVEPAAAPDLATAAELTALMLVAGQEPRDAARQTDC